MEIAPERLELLRSVPLFAGLGPAEMKQVVRTAQEIDHAAGRVIVGEGETGVGFHLILSGEANVSRGGLHLAVLHPGQYFGEIALIDGHRRSATVTAVGSVRTLTILTWQFVPLLEEHPLLTIALLKELCVRLRRAEASLMQ